MAISARSLDASGHSCELEENYRGSLASLIEWLVTKKQLRVILVAHTTGPVADEDDRVPSRAIYDRLSREILGSVLLIEDDLGPAALASLYGSAALVILHSLPRVCFVLLPAALPPLLSLTLE